MGSHRLRMRRRRASLAVTVAVVAVVIGSGLTGVPTAGARPVTSPAPLPTRLSGFRAFFFPGNLLVSTSTYSNHAANVTPGQALPPGCTSVCGSATNNGTYPQVFNNDLVDGSFGITSQIELDQLTPSGFLIDTMRIPTDQLVTSFSSKSELALNLSTDGRDLTFMGYAAPVNTVDVSNSNTPAVIDPTNPVSASYYRAIAEIDQFGALHVTLTNAYSGNNGRAAVLNDSNGANVLYTAGNAGNGANPQPGGVVLGAGAQIATPQSTPEAGQNPGTPTPVGSFSVTQLGIKADKIGKDDNFRGLSVFDNVVYYTKGSGGNGVDTVYFVDTSGHACPDGTGLPVPGAALPSAPLAYDAALLASKGLTPSNMCILRGFPTTLAKVSTDSFPFGIWFANPGTLYVAQEGDGINTYSSSTGTYTEAATGTGAGLQKWVLHNGTWTLAYTLRAGLGLGVPYTVARYPTGTNPATGLPWSPATDGVRNLTGRVNPDGTVTIWAVTSTVSGSGDQGADPNRLVAIDDPVNASSPSAHEQFRTVRSAGFGQVLRGVSLTPGT